MLTTCSRNPTDTLPRHAHTHTVWTVCCAWRSHQREKKKGFDVYKLYFEGIFPTRAAEIFKQHLLDFCEVQAKDQRWPCRWPPVKMVYRHGAPCQRGLLWTQASLHMCRKQKWNHCSLKIMRLLSASGCRVKCHRASNGRGLRENAQLYFTCQTLNAAGFDGRDDRAGEISPNFMWQWQQYLKCSFNNLGYWLQRVKTTQIIDWSRNINNLVPTFVSFRLM